MKCPLKAGFYVDREISIESIRYSLAACAVSRQRDIGILEMQTTYNICHAATNWCFPQLLIQSPRYITLTFQLSNRLRINKDEEQRRRELRREDSFKWNQLHCSDGYSLETECRSEPGGPLEHWCCSFIDWEACDSKEYLSVDKESFPLYFLHWVLWPNRQNTVRYIYVTLSQKMNPVNVTI